MIRFPRRKAVTALGSLVAGIGLLTLVQTAPVLGQGYGSSQGYGTSGGQSTSGSGGYQDYASSGGTYPADIVAYDSYFQPITLVGAPGQRATLRIWNSGHHLHSFTLPLEGVDVDVPPGQGREVQISFPSAGWFTYGCKYHFQTDAMYGYLRTS